MNYIIQTIFCMKQFLQADSYIYNSIYVTRPAKIGHVGRTGTEYLHSVLTCIIKSIKCSPSVKTSLP